MRRVLYFNVTYRCNQKCVFCFSHNTNSAGAGREMTRKQFASCLKGCRPGDRVVLNGGEPTLHPDLLRMVEAAKEKGAEVVLYTNGVALGVGRLADDLLCAGIDRITVPIHGSGQLHDAITGVSGSHDLVVRGISNVSRYGRRSVLELKFIVTKMMCDQGYSIWDDIKNLVESGSVSGVVLTGQVNTRVAVRTGSLFTQLANESAFLADVVHELNGHVPVKLYDVEICKMPSSFQRWFDDLVVSSAAPEYEYYFADSVKCPSRKMSYNAMRSSPACLGCARRQYCRSIVDGYLVAEIGAGCKKLVLE